ncbi:MAG TPA: flagellar biosynthetic protein FliO [Alphaproteobacteria bacterium]
MDYLRFVIAFAFVMSLMGILAILLKKYGKGGKGFSSGKRLSVIEIKPIDARHRLALVKCDDTEHVLVLGPGGQTLVQSNPSKASS